MSLEKKRRLVGNLEQDLLRALNRDPFVGLDVLLTTSGLVPSRGDPLTLGWGQTSEAEQSLLKERASQVAMLVTEGLRQATDFRIGICTIDAAITRMTEALSAISDPFDGLTRRKLDVAALGKAAELRWTFGDALVLEARIDKRWVDAAAYDPNPESLGVSVALLNGLRQYETAWRQRREQTDQLVEQMGLVRDAWDKHPARKDSLQYVVSSSSDTASEMRRITLALTGAQRTLDDWKAAGDIESWGWRRFPGQAMFTEGASFAQALAAMKASLAAIESTASKRLGRSIFAAEPTPIGDFDLELRQASEARILDAMLGDIDRLYTEHPIRRRFEAIMRSIETGELAFDPTRQGLDEQVQALDDMNVAAISVASEFTEGRLSFEDARKKLDEIRNDLAAVDASFEASEATTDVERVCAKIMAQPARFPDMPANLMKVDDPRVLAALAIIEGTDWVQSQLRHPDPPTGLVANRDAWRVLRDMGQDGIGLTVADLLEGAGIIEGEEGRLYEVCTDGRLALVSTSTDDLVAQAAEDVGLLVR